MRTYAVCSFGAYVWWLGQYIRWWLAASSIYSVIFCFVTSWIHGVVAVSKIGSSWCRLLDENISAILGLKASVGVVGLKAFFRQGSLWNSGPSQPQLLAAMPSGANGFASQVSYILEGGKGDIGWLPGRSCLGGCGSSFGGCKPIVGVGRLGYVCIAFSVFSSLVFQYLCQSFLAWKAKTRTPTKWEKTWLFGRTRLVRTTILRTE